MNRPGLAKPTFTSKSISSSKKSIYQRPMTPLALRSHLGEADDFKYHYAPNDPCNNPEPPFLSLNAIQNKDKKLMLAWWDDFKKWEEAPGHQGCVKYPDLMAMIDEEKQKAEAQGAKSDSNRAIDRWLVAMEMAVPDIVIAKHEAAVDPRHLRPKLSPTPKPSAPLPPISASMTSPAMEAAKAIKEMPAILAGYLSGYFQ